MGHRVSAGGIVGVGLDVGGARFAKPARLFMLGARVLIGLSDTRPLSGPKLGIFARKLGQDGFDVFLFGAPKDFLLPCMVSDFRFNFVETLDATHNDLTARLLKKTHRLRCAQSPRSNVLAEYAFARRVFARLASEIFLSSLQTEFLTHG